MVKLVSGTTRPSTGSIAAASCTIQDRNQDFCDAPAWPDAPFPICRSHAIDLYIEMRGLQQDAIRDASGYFPELDASEDPISAALEQQQMAKLAARKSASVVYYIRIGDYIKIGYTTQLSKRISALRVDPDKVLATEPGGQELEAKRHRQFSSLRQGRREDFKPTFALIRHVDAIRERHGRPIFN